MQVSPLAKASYIVKGKAKCQGNILCSSWSDGYMDVWMHAKSFQSSRIQIHDPMDCSTPGFPVHHHLPEFVQVHVCWISDSIQPSHPLSPSSPSASNLSQHQGLFQWFESGGQIIGASASASALPKRIQGWFPLRLTGLISLLSNKGGRELKNWCFWTVVLEKTLESPLEGTSRLKDL